MNKIKINKIEPLDLTPVSTEEDYFSTKLYDTPYLITNNKTILFTNCLAPCVALAVFVKDSSGICRRILCHCPYAPVAPYHSLEGRIEKYLKSIGEIVELKAMIASFDTFFEAEISDFDCERDSLILDRISSLFAFWKETHPDFEIPIIQSSALGVNPDGEFLSLSQEDVYAEYLRHKNDFPSFNTKYNEEDLTLSTTLERLNQFSQSNKETDEIPKK